MYVVLAVKKYSFAQEGTGQIVEGVTVHYCDEPEVKEESKGLFPMKITAPIEAFKDFTTVPGLYDMKLSLKPDAKGKASVSFAYAKFLKPLVIPQLNTASTV